MAWLSVHHHPDPEENIMRRVERDRIRIAKLRRKLLDTIGLSQAAASAGDARLAEVRIKRTWLHARRLCEALGAIDEADGLDHLADYLPFPARIARKRAA